MPITTYVAARQCYPEFKQERHEFGQKDLPTEFLRGRVITEAFGGDTPGDMAGQIADRKSGDVSMSRWTTKTGKPDLNVVTTMLNGLYTEAMGVEVPDNYVERFRDLCRAVVGSGDRVILTPRRADDGPASVSPIIPPEHKEEEVEGVVACNASDHGGLGSVGPQPGDPDEEYAALTQYVPEDQVRDTEEVWKAELAKIDRGEMFEFTLGLCSEYEHRELTP